MSDIGRVKEKEAFFSLFCTERTTISCQLYYSYYELNQTFYI